MDKYLYQAYRYALVICRNKKDNKFLVLQEKFNKGWWIPGGKVQVFQKFKDAAIRQCKEETGIDVEIKGIIRIDYGRYITRNSLRVIYYAEPALEQIPKQKEDQHSIQAAFMSLKQIQQLQWRSPQIYDYPHYIEKGGNIYPLQIFVENYNN